MKSLEKKPNDLTWLGRFCVCARWDCRWAVVIAQTKEDICQIVNFFITIVAGFFVLPWYIVRAIFRWPCKPFYWAWLAWQNPKEFEHIKRLDSMLKD